MGFYVSSLLGNPSLVLISRPSSLQCAFKEALWLEIFTHCKHGSCVNMHNNDQLWAFKWFWSECSLSRYTEQPTRELSALSSPHLNHQTTQATQKCQSHFFINGLQWCENSKCQPTKDASTHTRYAYQQLTITSYLTKDSKLLIHWKSADHLRWRREVFFLSVVHVWCLPAAVHQLQTLHLITLSPLTLSLALTCKQTNAFLHLCPNQTGGDPVGTHHLGLEVFT